MEVQALFMVLALSTAAMGSPLRLNLQTFNFTGDMVHLDILPSDITCHYFLAEVYSNGLGSTASHNYTITNPNEVLRIPKEALVSNFLRVTARHQNGSVCAEDQSFHTYYHFPSNFAAGITTLIPDTGSVTIPISTAHCDYPVLQLPENSNTNCHCLLIENTFSDCMESNCEIDYQISLLANGSAVVLHNLTRAGLTRAAENFLVHIRCDYQHCTSEDSCFLVSVLSSSFKIQVTENGSTTTAMTSSTPPSTGYSKNGVILLTATAVTTATLLLIVASVLLIMAYFMLRPAGIHREKSAQLKQIPREKSAQFSIKQYRSYNVNGLSTDV